MDRKNEVPAGKENYYVLPIVNWHEVGRASHPHSTTALFNSAAGCCPQTILGGLQQSMQC